jgi:hypothetical protein
MSELSPETEDLLARGREGTPLSASRRDELKGAVLAKIALGAGVAGTSLTATSTSAAAWTMTTKTIGVALIAAVIGTGTVGVVHFQRRAHAPQASKQASQPNDAAIAANDPAPAISSAASPIAVAPALNVGSEAPQTLPIVQPTLDVAPPPIVNPQTTASQSSAPVVAHANVGSSTTPSPGSPNTPNSQAIVSSPSSGSDPVFANGGSNAVATTAPHASSLEEETALLRSAHEALQANDPARALRLLDEHASRFPSGALEPEESADRVFALCAEQKTDAARTAANTFLSAHPTGPLAVRVRASCGGH